ALGLEFGLETVRRWFEKEGAVKKARRIKPSLSEAQKKRRTDYICDQVDETAGNYFDMGNVIHLDESWFFLLKPKETVRIFPGETISGSPRVQHKSPLPKIMVIVANARPDPSHNFDGEIGIWRICILKTAERSSKRRKRGEESSSTAPSTRSGTRTGTSTNFCLRSSSRCRGYVRSAL
ncbi:unnamed protein product, partial [Laminaria digitata]